MLARAVADDSRKRSLPDATQQALVAAIQACEKRSAAEIVIAVRARSASYLHADLIAGIAVATATLAFLLYSPIEFPLWSFVIETVLAGAVAGAVASHLPVVRRLLTPRSARRAWVRRAAQATFLERGVDQTARRTGLLIYVGLTERVAEVVADRGVRAAVSDGDLLRACVAIDAAVAREGVGTALVRAVEALGDVLEPALPRTSDDVNELPDEVSAA